MRRGGGFVGNALWGDSGVLGRRRGERTGRRGEGEDIDFSGAENPRAFMIAMPRLRTRRESRTITRLSCWM
jgi:hypothetical protein